MKIIKFLLWGFFRFIFSAYLFTFWFGGLLAVQIIAITEGAANMSKMMMYGMGFQILGIIASLICGIFLEYRAGNKVTRKKEGSVFYFSASPFIMPILFFIGAIIATFLTVMLAANNIDEIETGHFSIGVSVLFGLFLILWRVIVLRWSSVNAYNINTLIVKFPKLGLIPWISKISPGEIHEAIFKIMILPTGKYLANDELKKIKIEIDDVAKKLAIKTVDMSDFIDKIKKLHPEMAIILNRIILKSVNGKKTPIILNERSDFRKFTDILFKGKKPMIIWKSKMMYHGSY